MNKKTFNLEQFSSKARPETLIKKYRKRKTKKKIKKAEKQFNKAVKEKRNAKKAEKLINQSKKHFENEKHKKSIQKAEKAFKKAVKAEKIETANLYKLGARLKREVQLFPKNNSKHRKILVKKAMKDIQETQEDFLTEQIVTLFNKAYQLRQKPRQKIRRDTKKLVETDSNIVKSRKIGELQFYRFENQ